MITEIRSTVRQALANGATIVKSSWKEFAISCKNAGYTMFSEWLNPAPGKVACQFFSNPSTNQQVIVVLSKGVAALRASGKLPDAALKTLSIIDGKNAKGEQRYYLSSNGITEITVDEAIKHADAAIAAVNKMSMDKLNALAS